MNPNGTKSMFFGSEKGWSEKLKEKASALVEDGIIPMLTDLSFTEEDLLLLKQRIENAKNVIGMGAEEFSQRCDRGQILTGGVPKSKDEFIEDAKIAPGYAMPKEVATWDISKLEDATITEFGLWPVINLSVVTTSSDFGLVYLIHEMIHVLASPEYITKLRGDNERNSDEGFTEFFARLAALYCLDTKDEYKR